MKSIAANVIYLNGLTWMNVCLALSLLLLLLLKEVEIR